eukprot:m.76204 g.76204  ORF g.76204 m.76204 type:complete len:112 (-) comp19013_c0_seq2:2955-3290(-)
MDSKRPRREGGSNPSGGGAAGGGGGGKGNGKEPGKGKGKGSGKGAQGGDGASSSWKKGNGKGGKCVRQAAPTLSPPPPPLILLPLLPLSASTHTRSLLSPSLTRSRAPLAH